MAEPRAASKSCIPVLRTDHYATLPPRCCASRRPPPSAPRVTAPGKAAHTYGFPPGMLESEEEMLEALRCG